LRTASGRRLAAIASIAAGLALSAGIAQGALTGGGPTPPPKALAAAILAAFEAPEPDGVTARIEFTNDLLPSSSLPRHTASPLLAGADGRLWIQKSGDFRVELQSDAGDVQIVAVGERLTVYDASAQTLYRARLPRAHHRPGDHEDGALTRAKVQRALDRLARAWSLSGAEPGSTAGRPAYTVKVSPRERGGLLGAAALAWDAVRGAPLRAALYARGRSEPVLELKATEISYGAVADSDVRVAPPPAAEVVELDPADEAKPRASTPSVRRGDHRAAAREPADLQRRLGFELAAPAALAGLPRTHLRLVRFGGLTGALSVYGEGLGAIAVLQRPTGASRDGHRRGRRSLRLPRVDVGGAIGAELATALGTVVTFTRGGVAYVVAGSVAPAVAERAARGLR
ncbi:MAG TPA: hypothetical protein VGV67_11935, partial [Solirubrobacteraceae bacterium]|nr:hypothetical protein [Solirubrobacteraceae bacterium]